MRRLITRPIIDRTWSLTPIAVRGPLIVSRGNASASAPALLEKTYHQLFQEQITRYPHKDFLISKHEKLKWTYLEASRHQDALAAGMLEANGNGPFATALPLRAESLMAQVATSRANVTWATIPPGANAKDLEEQIKIINPGTLVWPAKVHKTVQLDEIYDVFPYMNTIPKAFRITDPRFPNLRNVLQTSKQDLDGMTMFGDFLVYHNPVGLKRAEAKVNAKSQKIVVLNQEKKEIQLTHYGVLNTGYLVGQAVGLHEEDRLYSTLPQDTGAGLSLGIGLALSNKLTLVYASELFDAALVLESLKSDHVTALVIRPEELEALLSAIPEGTKLPNLSRVIIAASPDSRPSEDLVALAHSRLNSNVFVAVGSDETSGVFAVSEANSATSFTALPHLKVSSQAGTITVEGFNVSSGYQNDPQLTSTNFKAGAFLTGVKGKVNKANITFE